MPESNSQRIAKNTGFLFFRTLLLLFIGLFTSRVVLKTLGFEDYGIYNVVGSVVLFFGFLKTALTNATYRYLAYEIGAGDEEKLKNIYSMAINSHLLLAVLLLVLLEIGGVWFINNKLNISSDRMLAANWAFQFSLFTFCISIVQTPFHSNIIAHEKMDFYAFVSILEGLLKLAVCYLIVISPIDKLITYSFLLAAVTSIILILQILYCNKKFKECIYIKYWDIDVLRQFITYSGWSLVVNVTDVTTTQCISIFFNLFLGVVANAALGIANIVTSSINSFLNTFTQAFNPQIIKSYASKQYLYFMKLLFSASKLSYYLLFFICVPFVVNIDYLLTIWLGDFPAYTKEFIFLVLIFNLIDSFQSPLWQAVHATGNLKTHQLLMASIKVTVIPIMYFLLKSGAIGTSALWAWVIGNFLCAIIRTIYMKYLIGLPLRRYFFDVVLKILVVSIISIPIPLYISHILGSSFESFILSSSSSVVIMSFIVYFYGINTEERLLVKNITNPILNKFRISKRNERK